MPASVALSQLGESPGSPWLLHVSASHHCFLPKCGLWLPWEQLASPGAVCSCGEGLEGEEEDTEGLTGGCRQQTAAIVHWQTGSHLGNGNLQRSTHTEEMIEGGLSKTGCCMPFPASGRGSTLGFKLSCSDKEDIAITPKYDFEAMLPPTIQTHLVQILSGLSL